MGISFWCAMKKHLLKKMCPAHLTKGASLGSGVDGEVFSIIDYPNRVIKLGLIYHGEYDNYDYNSLANVLEFIYLNKPPAYVHVYEYGRMCETDDVTIYYCVMEKLLEISEDEGRIFHSILSHEDFGKKKDLSPVKVQELIYGMSALDLDAKKVTLFCNNIRTSPVIHWDMHTRNIMKDDAGNFKLIDLDRVTLSK